MSVALRRQRDGKLRPYWYGEYVETDGRRKVVNVGEWRGTPPPSLLGTGDKPDGDADFEASRREAEARLQDYASEARRKGRADHLTERLIESKTGTTPEYVTIQSLCERWLTMPRDADLSKGRVVAYRAIFGRFAAFMAGHRPRARFLYEVTAADVGAFAKAARAVLSPEYYDDHMRTLRPAFDRFLPPGAANPFRTGLKKHAGQNGNGDRSIHRKPFTPEQLRALLDTANGDGFMYPLIVTAACSGMRKADVCGLKWADVDLAGGMLAVKTSKTGAEVEIPIFAPLRAVLDARKDNGSPFVFPEAARMMNANRGGLTWRFKKIIARAFTANEDRPAPVTPSPEIEAEGAATIVKKVPEGERRDRILDTFKRYIAGASVRQIEKATGRPRATVSADLSAVEGWTGKRFVRTQGPNMKREIARVTRAPRERGMQAASLFDWHALRTTWVTLALSAGVPLELVRRVTGHGTVDIVLRHYFRPGRAEFKAALAGALPDVLTGGTPAKTTAAEELAALAGKLAAGTATKEDKARLRKLAAKV